MKLKLFIHFLIALFCCWITVGLSLSNPVVHQALCFMFATLGIYLTLTWLEKLIRYIYKSKKKIKNKRIKIKVQFESKDNPKLHFDSQVFSDDDFTLCVQNIFRYAKIYDCNVKSMALLTTED